MPMPHAVSGLPVVVVVSDQPGHFRLRDLLGSMMTRMHMRGGGIRQDLQVLDAYMRSLPAGHAVAEMVASVAPAGAAGDDYVFACVFRRGQRIEFDAPAFARLSDDAAMALIGHELSHVWMYATTGSGGSEQDANATATRWGFSMATLWAEQERLLGASSRPRTRAELNRDQRQRRAEFEQLAASMPASMPRSPSPGYTYADAAAADDVPDRFEQLAAHADKMSDADIRRAATRLRAVESELSRLFDRADRGQMTAADLAKANALDSEAASLHAQLSAYRAARGIGGSVAAHTRVEPAATARFGVGVSS